MEKKIYWSPDMEVVEFEAEDIITTSTGQIITEENELPPIYAD